MNRHSTFIIAWVVIIGVLCPSFAQADGFNFRKPSPLYTKGEIFTRTATGDVAIGVGSTGQVLSVDPTTATGLRWGTLGASGSGTVTNSGTLTSNAVIIGAGTTVIQAITADTSTSHFLASTADAPAFRQILTGDTVGILPVERGGTGLTGGTTGGVAYFVNGGRIGTSGTLTQYGVVLGGGSGNAPTVTTADTVVTHAFMATAAGPAFRQILTTDVVGVYPSGGSGTPGGATTQIQYNSGGSFAGATLITTDGVRVAVGPGTSTLVSMDVAGNFRTVPFALTDGTTINVDASRSNFFTVTLAGAPRTLAAPTNGVNGQKIVIRISQDATGSRKIGTAAGIKYGTDVPSYDATTTAGNKDYMFLVCNSNSSSWDVAGISKGYN